MSDYLQPYNIAFAGADPPLYPHVVNDEFVRQRPPVLPPLPPPVLPIGPYTYVALEPKWVSWNPGNSINFRAIDTRRRMAMLSGAGDKQWGGIAQALPLPGLAQALSYVLYMRVVPGFVDVVGNGTFDEVLTGLVLGEDLLGAPTTSPLISIQTAQNHAVGASPIAAEMQCSAWANYAAVNAPDQIVSSGWPLTYLRARIRQALSGGNVWTVDVTFDVSATGEGYQAVMAYTRSAPLRHVAFAQRSRGGVTQVNFCDFVRLFLQPADDQLTATGERQQLGSV